MTAADLRKWLAFGTGVGIEIGPDDLLVTVVRLRPTGPRVLGEMSIPRFQEQAAGEWGDTYAKFLNKLGAGHLAATVLLPREELTVRQVSLPGVADKDLPAAVRFEIDSLNPYSEEEAAYDWARVGKTSSVLIGITRRSALERYAALFSQAGVKVASFTFTAPAIYTALRLFSNPPAGGFLALEESDGQCEIYGESPTRPLFSARLDQPGDRSRSLAIAELRLAPETDTAVLHQALPQPLAAPPEYDLARASLSYANALACAAPLRALSVNLLPQDERRAASRLRYLPTAVLAVLVLLLGTAVVGYPKYSDRQYMNLLQARIRQLEPQARRAAGIDRQIATTRNRAQTLDNFRRHTRDDLDALSELTRLLAPPTWLTSMQLTRDSISISGQTEQAAGLIKLLDGSKQFQGSAFSLPLQPGKGGEVFSIRTSRKGIAP